MHQLGARIVVAVDAVAKAHELDAGVLVLDLFHELANLGHAALALDVFQHVQAGFVGAAMRRPPQAGHARRNRRKRIGSRRTTQAYGGRRGILLVVGVQDENSVHRPLDDRVDLIILAGRAKHHAQEVARVAQIVAWMHVRLANAVFVRHGHQRGQLGDQPHGGHIAVLCVMNIHVVAIEGRHGAHQTGQHRHGVCVTAEASQEKLHLLVHHGVAKDARVEFAALLPVGKFSIEQQVAGVEVIAMSSQLLDGVAAVQQFALVAVDVGDGRLARRSRQEPRIVGEHAGLTIQLADVNHVRTDGALINR